MMDESEDWYMDEDVDVGEEDIGPYQHHLDGDIEEMDIIDYDDTLGENSISVKSLAKEMLTCSLPVIKQVNSLLILILISCLFWHVVNIILKRSFHFNGKIYHTFVTIVLHVLSVSLGLFILHRAAYELWWIIIGLTVSLAVVFILDINSHFRHSDKQSVNWETFITLGICSSVQLYCELYVNPVQWHQIRGSIMIIIMKSISFSMEQKTLDSNHVNSQPCILLWTPLYRGLVWLSYCLCPASLLFGPWFSPLKYEEMIRSDYNSTRFSLKNIILSLLHTVKLFGTSLLCLVYSTCSTYTLISKLTFQPWLYAYFSSQSFRFSHYFVCISSESFMNALGYCDKYSVKSKEKLDDNNKEKEKSAIEVYKPFVVTRPWSIEFPRSLVEVVIHWNLPMHTWLKQYVYKPLRAYGHIYAIVGTYAASSLLHGLNFQLSAVLFSIGIYAYIEYVLREKLATILNACVASRPCPETCSHVNKNSSWVYWWNFAFSCLAIFHLAYLAVMFDTSEQQYQGYSMWHALNKWYGLGYLSHIVAFATFLFYKYL
ncbi:unnamed protein product [Trichobilharzia szidati]|nr:unnamed protein product [Trichobilharzia szidati]